MTKGNTKASILILILFIGIFLSAGLSLKINNDLNNQIEVNAHTTEQLEVSNKAIKDLDEKVVKLEKENKKQKSVTEEKDIKIVEQEKKIDSLIKESKKKDSEISDLISKKEQEKKNELVAIEKAEKVEIEKTKVQEPEAPVLDNSKATKVNTEVKKEESVDTTGKTLTVEATAYSTNQPSMSNLTYTEINLDVNPDVIAVDPNFIPLGSTVYIEGYGTFIAGDTGGDINGNRIDIHMTNLDNAVDFGRKTMEVVVTN